MSQDYHSQLKIKIRQLVIATYQLTSTWPKSEIYGLTSQVQRSAVSVGANHVEGYARQTGKSHRLFIGIAYGSLQELEYLLDLSVDLRYSTKSKVDMLRPMIKEIGAMLWGIMRRLELK